MALPRSLALLLVWAVALRGFAAPAPEWKDGKGATFRGEPVEVLGPLLMFRTGAVSSKFLPARGFSPEECVRFYQAIAHRAARADRWSDAYGEASRECVGALQRPENGQLRAVDFSRVPEPELMLILGGGRRAEGAEAPHYLLDNLAPFVNRIQRVYPGRVATIVTATAQASLNVRSLPSARTWLVADPKKLSGMKVLSRFIPQTGFMAVLVTREGIPLIGGPVNDVGEVMKFVDHASDILWQLNPENPRGARDRLHYLSAVRPVQFADATAAPALLIDPLRTDVLRQRGVKRVVGNFEVGADGHVRTLELDPASEIPPPLVAPVTQALQRNSVFLPAIDHGTPTSGQFHYSLTIDAVDPKLAADAAWVKGEARLDVPFKSWLVLKAIKVPEQVFSMIQGIGADGTVMLSAVTAGDPNKVSLASQKNAFNSDWFAALGGPGAVRPVAGQKQEVDGEKFVWKKMKPEDGRVDFMDGAAHDAYNYCVGYAWTVVEVAEDTDAWLGIGSDDGLKIWVNGELAVDQWVQRTGRLDDDVVALRLKKGTNAFLIKIQNMRGIWNFTARLRVRGN